MPSKRKLLLIIGIISIVIVAGLGLVLLQRSPPMPEALSALESNAQVQVTTDLWYVFEPLNMSPTVGVIFYPGGNVAPEAYAPLAQLIAQLGVRVVIVPMPFDLAVFAPASALEVIQADPSMATWVMAGHSLGGAMAAQFVADNPEVIEGLILLAGYPAGSTDLSALPISCVTIYGTLDGVLNEAIPDTLVRLPTNTTMVAITGGNHAYFGYYGEQAGDNAATITREAQHQQTVTAIDQLLGSL